VTHQARPAIFHDGADLRRKKRHQFRLDGLLDQASRSVSRRIDQGIRRKSDGFGRIRFDRLAYPCRVREARRVFDQP